MPYKNREDRLAACARNYAKNKDTYKQRTKKNRELRKEHYDEMKRKSHLKVAYGITPEDYNQMFVDQDGCCAICSIHQSELNKRLAVDHCHATGEVRGLLCDKCNMALGLFKDDQDLLNKAIHYLQGE